jgi:hypothetical protein
LNFQTLWGLKQALLASAAQRFVELPGLASVTIRPNASTIATTTTIRTTPRPTSAVVTTTTTVRPNTVISIQQLFPAGVQLGKYPPEPIYFPGQLPGGVPLQQPGQGLLPGAFPSQFITGIGQQQGQVGLIPQGQIPGALPIGGGGIQGGQGFLTGAVGGVAGIGIDPQFPMQFPLNSNSQFLGQQSRIVFPGAGGIAGPG